MFRTERDCTNYEMAAALQLITCSLATQHRFGGGRILGAMATMEHQVEMARREGTTDAELIMSWERFVKAMRQQDHFVVRVYATELGYAAVSQMAASRGLPVPAVLEGFAFGPVHLRTKELAVQMYNAMTASMGPRLRDGLDRVWMTSLRTQLAIPREQPQAIQDMRAAVTSYVYLMHTYIEFWTITAPFRV